MLLAPLGKMLIEMAVTLEMIFWAVTSLLPFTRPELMIAK
jgi:hypothetical protein